MPICRKCNNRFPCKIIIDGTKRNISKRKYCLICSPFGQHNTKKLENKSYLDISCTCSSCNRIYVYRRSSGCSKSKCNSCWQREQREKKKTVLLTLLGNKCSRCGYNKYSGALEFHHIDPRDKEFELSMRNLHLKMEKLKKEALKCELVCSNCHKEIHGSVSPHSDKV